MAGGRSSRMGGNDKGLLDLNGMAMIKHVIARIQPQVGRLLINANRNIERYEHFGVRVIKDIWPDHPGPLAGVASAMAVADTDYLLCVPCDTPLLPKDLADRLLQAMLDNNAEASVVRTAQSLQPVCVLLRCDLADNLKAYYTSGHRKVRAWLNSLKLVEVDFSDCADAFINLNTPEELQSLSMPESDGTSRNLGNISR